MPNYRIRVLRAGAAVAGVEVIAGDILYASSTGVDGIATEATSGRSGPVRVPVEILGPGTNALGTTLTLRPDVTVDLEI